METMIANFRESLAAITNPRFFETERGFQGELLVQLTKRFQLLDCAIVEQEYQKRQQAHGLTIRPDIIIHEPFDPQRHGARTEGNLAVIELKRKASVGKATQDFKSLADMIQVLHYPIGFFVNIGSTVTHGNLVPPEARGRIICFAVSLVEGNVSLISSSSF